MMESHRQGSPLHLTWRLRKQDRAGSKEPKSADIHRLWTACPAPDYVSDYDLDNLMLYARLLDAETEGGDLYEMARIIFGLGPSKESLRAEIVVASHLKRAHWMLENGYPFLLW